MITIGNVFLFIITAIIIFLFYVGTHCPAFCSAHTKCAAYILELAYGVAPTTAIRFGMIAVLSAALVNVITWRMAFFFVTLLAIIYGVASAEAASCFHK